MNDRGYNDGAELLTMSCRFRGCVAGLGELANTDVAALEGHALADLLRRLFRR